MSEYINMLDDIYYQPIHNVGWAEFNRVMLSLDIAFLKDIGNAFVFKDTMELRDC